MVENLTAQAVLKDKLSSAATNLFSKADHAIQNFGKNKPSEEAPLSFKVIHKGGALVRSGYETTSAQVHQLAAGEVVTCVDLVGRRARIISPVEGWVSTETKDSVQIMRQCAMQRKSQQNEAFEHMFEQKFNRLKKPTGGGSSGLDPRDPRAEGRRSREQSRSPSPPPARGGRDRDQGRDRKQDQGRDRDRDRDDDYARDSRGGRGTDAGSKQAAAGSDAGFVPRLSAPGTSKGGPAVLAPPPGSGRPAAPSGPAGQQQAAPAPAAGSGGDLFDLLGVDDSKPPAAAAPQQAGALDLFGDAPAAPAAPAFSAPAAAAPAPQGGGFGNFGCGGPAQGGGSDWDAFQTSGSAGAAAPGAGAFNPFMGAGGAAAAGPQPGFGQGGPGMASGYAALNSPQAPAMGGAGGGMAAMGWGGGQGQMPNVMAGAGMQNPMGMGGGYMGGAPAAASMQNPGASNWNAFAGGAAPARPPAAAAAPQAGMPFAGFGAPAGGSNVDNLMAKTMGGLSNLSLDSSAPKPSGGMPMNFMR